MRMIVGFLTGSRQMEDRFTPKQLEQIKKELNEAVVTKEHPDVLTLLKHWKAHSPKMVERLKQQGILEDYAVVTLDRFNRDVANLMSTSQMSMSEAQLECQGALLMEKENDLQDMEMEQEWI